MFDPVNEPSFRLDVAGLSDAFDVLAFTGREAISEPYVFDVDMLISDPTLDLASLLYRCAVLHFGPPGNCVHGQLHELVQHDHRATGRVCRVRLGPKLSGLSQRFSQRIFRSLSVPQILGEVLGAHGITGDDLRFDLSKAYAPRDFCTQHQESDLKFVQRLCASDGLHFHFQVHERGHCVVFADDQSAFRYGEEARLEAAGATLAAQQFEIQAGLHAMDRVNGQTSLMTLRSGQLMAVMGHPVAEWNHSWLLTHVEHTAVAAVKMTYSNRFRATHWARPFVPTQAFAKPRMNLQRAWVVEVDEPGPDPLRPVAVQFDWNYQGEGARSSYCWLPLDASLNIDAVTSLSPGTELVVSYCEGDPDRPVISGFLHTPPFISLDSPATSLDECPTVGGLLSLLRSGEPLTLLCLLPGGGSFSDCTQELCTCRMATRFGQSVQG